MQQEPEPGRERLEFHSFEKEKGNHLLALREMYE